MERPFSSGSLFRSILMVWRASWSPYYPHNVADFILYRNPYFSNVCKAENSAVLTADGSLAMDLGFVYFLAYRRPPHKLQHARLQQKIRNTSYITCRPDLYKTFFNFLPADNNFLWQFKSKRGARGIRT